MVPSVAANFALDATLLMGPIEPGGRELRREQVVRAQRDEPVSLDPPAALQHLLHRRPQVVEPDLREHAAEPLERLHVQLQERLLGLDQRRLAERRAGERRAHHEQMHLHRHPTEHHQRLAPVDLGLDARARGPAARTPRRPATPARACEPARTDGPSPQRHRHRAHQPAAARSAWRYAAASPARPIGQQPLVDHRPIRPQLRRRPAHRRALRRRYRRRQRLLHRPAMHPMPDRQPPDREPLPITVPSDLLELLHPGSHSLWRLPLELDEARTVGRRSDGGGASSDHRSGAS